MDIGNSKNYLGIKMYVQVCLNTLDRSTRSVVCIMNSGAQLQNVVDEQDVVTQTWSGASFDNKTASMWTLASTRTTWESSIPHEHGICFLCVWVPSLCRSSCWVQ